MGPVILLGTQATGLTVVIDGVTYRPVAVDSSGRLIVVGSGAGGAVVVSATDLDIRNLTKALDELYTVLRTDAGVAYDARDRSWTVTETVPVSQATPDSLRVGNYGRYSGAWQRQPLAFGFSAGYFQFDLTAAAAGANTISGTTVPANTLRVLTGAHGVDQTAAVTRMTVAVVSGGNNNRLKMNNGGAAFTHIDWQGQAFMLPGDIPRLIYEGCTLNDALRTTFYGYDMLLNL